MTEEQKVPAPQTSMTQDPQQLQVLLKQTMKENKSLQNKNSKLESKYVQLFKQNKALKQDRTILVSFALSLFTDPGGHHYLQEPALGQCSIQQLNTLREQKESTSKQTIKDLEKQLVALREGSSRELEKEVKTVKQKLNAQWQVRIKNAKDSQNKEFHSLQREIDSLKKTLDLRNNQISQLKTLMQTRTQELSKVSKEKLKMEHHLNNIRKKEISQELTPPKEPDQSKMFIDKNEYLSLKQQVETLMAKRDELRKELKIKQQQLSSEQKMTSSLQRQLQKFAKFQRECDQKYELVRECSLQDLETMIVNYNAPELNINSMNNEEKMGAQTSEAQTNQKDDQIQREYLRNMVARFIKAETSGRNQQALTLLDIIGRLVKLDQEATLTLKEYISKQKQWWFIKY